MTGLFAKIKGFTLVRATLHKDAERYRWLRENSDRIKWDRGLSVGSTGYLGMEFQDAIDLAMAEEKK
jgi:hypothetical protein